MNTMRIVFVVFATTLCLFYVCHSCYQAWQYYKERHCQLIVVRRWPIVLSTCGFFLLNIFNQLLQMWVVLLQRASAYSDYIFYISVPGLLWSGTFRAYMLMADSRWTHHMHNHNWKSLIDSSLRLDEFNSLSEWLFVANRKLFGNARFMGGIFAALFAFHWIVGASLHLVQGKRKRGFAETVFNSSMLVLSLTSYVLIWNWGIISFLDVAKVRSELRKQTYGGATILVCYVSVALVPVKWVRRFWFQQMWCLFWATVAFALISVSLQWVLRFVEKYKLKENPESMEIAELRSPKTPQPMGTSKELLQWLLLDMDAVSAFMSHLMFEFSAENLLALAEMCQFQQRFEEAPSSVPLQFAADFPNSSIVRDSVSIHRTAKALVKKYVVEGAQFEVNVSYGCRKRLKRQLDDATHATGAGHCNPLVFRHCVAEISRLLLSSVRRFAQTNGFRKLVASRKRQKQSPSNDSIDTSKLHPKMTHLRMLERLSSDSLPAVDANVSV